MPELWTSSNQRARLASHEPSTLSRLLQEPATRLALSRTQPIRFHLDDFVLVDEHTHPVPWNRRFRYALFDHLLRLRTPQPDHPYWTNNSVPENLFPGDVHYYRAGEGTDACLRVVALNREFYDLENRRTTTGRIVGARAAVRNDHPHGHVREPLTAGAGNFLHCRWLENSGWRLGSGIPARKVGPYLDRVWPAPYFRNRVRLVRAYGCAGCGGSRESGEASACTGQARVATARGSWGAEDVQAGRSGGVARARRRGGQTCGSESLWMRTWMR